mgnify:CR=1 FL=1
MDRLLNLLAAIEEENLGYTKDVSPTEIDGWDAIIKCWKKVPKDEANTSFDFDGVLEVLNDFERYAVQDYVNPSQLQGEDKVTHHVEIRVKA